MILVTLQRGRPRSARCFWPAASQNARRPDAAATAQRSTRQDAAKAGLSQLPGCSPKHLAQNRLEPGNSLRLARLALHADASATERAKSSSLARWPHELLDLEAYKRWIFVQPPAAALVMVATPFG